MNRRITSLILGALVALFLDGCVCADWNLASRRNCIDASGAIVPGAKITLTNEETNATFSTTTTSAGAYVFDSVQLGTYTIAAEQQGFKKFVSKGNVLTVGCRST